MSVETTTVCQLRPTSRVRGTPRGMDLGTSRGRVPAANEATSEKLKSARNRRFDGFRVRRLAGHLRRLRALER